MYYIKLDRKWLGDRWQRVDFDSPTMKGYRTLAGARKGAARAINKSLSYAGAPKVCMIDFSVPHCPVTEVE